MSTAPASRSAPTPAPDAPIDTFSTCHASILEHLRALAALPGLLEQAALARRVAADSLAFIRDVVIVHHQDEEHELFPAVLASAAPGIEQDRVRSVVEQLTREHREVEGAYATLEAGLKAAASGRDARIEVAAVAALVGRYQAHARFEEEVFLPLSQRILARNGDHMAALGMALHLRHALPELLTRFGSNV